jgi:hypothetical protein
MIRLRVSVRRVLAVVAGLAILQCAIWATWGRSTLIKRVALDEAEFSARLAAAQTVPIGDPFEYLRLDEEVVLALDPSDIQEIQDWLSSCGPTIVVTPSEWESLFGDLEPEERWDLRGRFTCWRIVPRINLPLVAKIECDDMCSSVAWHGHTHWYAHVLGWWFPLYRSGDWVS